jgi:hypothetical protein
MVLTLGIFFFVLFITNFFLFSVYEARGSSVMASC